MKKTKTDFSESIDQIFFDLQMDIHDAIKNFEHDWNIISKSTKQELKK